MQIVRFVLTHPLLKNFDKAMRLTLDSYQDFSFSAEYFYGKEDVVEISVRHEVERGVSLNPDRADRPKNVKCAKCKNGLQNKDLQVTSVTTVYE